MVTRWWRLVAARPRRWRAALVVAALVAMWRVPCDVTTRHHFPALRPHRLAHLLADFTHQPDVSSWRVESDASNYTSWRYVVSYECGARCSGRAHVHAHDAHGASLAHGAAALQHTVRVVRRQCVAAPLLPWVTWCDELQTEAVVEGEAGARAGAGAGQGGATLLERAHGRCAALSALSGSCGAALRAQRDRYMQRLHAAAAALLLAD